MREVDVLHDGRWVEVWECGLAVLDHLAIGMTGLGDGWELFGGVLGGTWVYGMDSPGYWWGQLEFAAGHWR